MNKTAYKIGLRLAQLPFVRKAIHDRADLSLFRTRPTPRLLAGAICIAVSYATCWPVIALLTLLSIYWENRRYIEYGGPIFYIFSHILFFIGIALSGVKCSHVLLRWAARIGVERLLHCGTRVKAAKRSSSHVANQVR